MRCGRKRRSGSPRNSLQVAESPCLAFHSLRARNHAANLSRATFQTTCMTAGCHHCKPIVQGAICKITSPKNPLHDNALLSGQAQPRTGRLPKHGHASALQHCFCRTCEMCRPAPGPCHTVNMSALIPTPYPFLLGCTCAGCRPARGPAARQTRPPWAAGRTPRQPRRRPQTHCPGRRPRAGRRPPAQSRPRLRA